MDCQTLYDARLCQFSDSTQELILGTSDLLKPTGSKGPQDSNPSFPRLYFPPSLDFVQSNRG